MAAQANSGDVYDPVALTLDEALALALQSTAVEQVGLMRQLFDRLAGRPAAEQASSLRVTHAFHLPAISHKIP